VATRRAQSKSRNSSGTSAPARNGNDASANRGEAHRAAVTNVVNGLRRIVRALHRSHRVAEQRWDLSAAGLLVLQRLAEAPTLSVNELADRTFTHQSTVSVVVTRLVNRGLVRRERASDDLRRAELALTQQGRVLLQRAMSSAQTRLIDAADAMPTAQLRALGSGLDQLVDALGMAAEPPGMFFEDGARTSTKPPKPKRS
jgi:DNA-binding MarR family transcriptional regulator